MWMEVKCRFGPANSVFFRQHLGPILFPQGFWLSWHALILFRLTTFFARHFSKPIMTSVPLKHGLTGCVIARCYLRGFYHPLLANVGSVRIYLAFHHLSGGPINQGRLSPIAFPGPSLCHHRLLPTCRFFSWFCEAASRQCFTTPSFPAPA